MKKRIILGGRHGPVAGLLRPLVTIEVRSRSGEFVEIPFCVDSGSDTLGMPIQLAEQHNIPFPRQESSARQVAGLVGVTRQFRDYIRVRMFGEEFNWPCGFVETPASRQKLNYGVIGRIGFATAFHSCIEYPFCLIRRRTNHLPPWQRFLAFFAR